ncbi:MAG TPA: xylose isomerase, partial [Planctomycetaceae bacterium]|nr:xylose isomerase [Planctomycetaceae bacterium]
MGVDQREAVRLAAKYAFESVEPQGGFLAGLGPAEAKEFGASLDEYGLVWGAAGLSVEFRADEQRFKSDLKKLPRIAEALSAAG